MSAVRKVALGMGVLSILLSAVATALLGFLVHTSPEGSPFQPVLPSARSLSTTSCETLQTTCPLIVKHAETMSQLNDVYFRNYESAFQTVLVVALVWGALSGAVFLVIFVKSRNRESRGSTAF